MGARKRIRAEKIKEEKKSKAFAILRNCPTSPRKMRLVVDLVRGKQVNNAIDILRYTPKDGAIKVQKLLLSALANWQAKNVGVRIEDANLYVKEIFVDEGRMLKRIRTAPQGRAHRIRKRSNHVTVVLDSAVTNETQNTQS
ncbi:MAG: 50S ribosomal protein L22 [Bacteroidales bacterium]|jgi:large subunit ribosomal protein L22|nr:50S ribosomal protein L22 [Bacteroidales bacterium]MDD4384814.1 50S ribosomal protein L22 [Bacteroidales bacterium]MDY0196722.1 50S ribosomal protein L22 [Tenuifilaceae bacterium]